MSLDELDPEVMKIFRAAAKEKGQSLSKYLQEAGILTEYEIRKIRKHEVRLYPGERFDGD